MRILNILKRLLGKPILSEKIAIALKTLFWDLIFVWGLVAVFELDWSFWYGVGIAVFMYSFGDLARAIANGELGKK